MGCTVCLSHLNECVADKYSYCVKQYPIVYLGFILSRVLNSLRREWEDKLCRNIGSSTHIGFVGQMNVPRLAVKCLRGRGRLCLLSGVSYNAVMSVLLCSRHI